MERELLEFKNHISWICQCGISNNEKNVKCEKCHVGRYDYPKRINCIKCNKVLRNIKKGYTCECGRIY